MWRALGHAVLVSCPLIAALASMAARRRMVGRSRLPWLFFASSAAVAAVGELVRPFSWGSTAGAVPAHDVALMIFPLLYAAGAAVALRPGRVRGQAVEVALDGALILVAALVLLERVVLEPLTAAGPPPSLAVHVVAGQLAAVLAVLCAGLLVLWGDALIPGGAVPALAGAAVLMLAGSMLAVVDPGRSTTLVWVLSWGLLALAGVLARRAVGREIASTGSRRWLRPTIVPAATLVLGWLTIDTALRAGATPGIALGGVALALLLAVRTAHALRTADRQAEERRELAQTRALIEVSRALAGATELDRTLELVTRWSCRLLDAHAAGIELLAEDGETLEMRAAHGMPAEVRGMRVPVQGSFTGWVVQHLRPRAAASPGDGPYMQPRSVEVLGNVPTAAAPLVFGEKCLGVLFANRRDRPFDAGDLELLGALADQAALAIENARLFEQVHALSLTDPLTGLANRRQLERDLAREFAAARRGRRLVVVLFDLDNFKEYNDRHGHLAGDEVLRIFGQILVSSTRAMNLAARYGGDEFLVLLADSVPDGASIFVERVAESFRGALDHLGDVPVTVSAGIAAFRPEMRDPQELIAAADRGLYRVKADRPLRDRTRST